MRERIFVALLVLAGCQAPPEAPTVALHALVFRVQVAPSGELESFRLDSIVDPLGRGEPTVHDDWLVSACMVFRTTNRSNPAPTYQAGEPAAARYVRYFYDANHPRAFFGEDPEKAVLQVPEGLAASSDSDVDGGGVCASNQVRPAV